MLDAKADVFCYPHLYAGPCVTLKGHLLFGPISLSLLSITNLTLQQPRTLVGGLGVVSTLVCTQ